MSSWGALGLPLAPAAAAAGAFAGADDVVFFLCARVVVGRTRATTIMVGPCTSTRRATQTSTSEYVTARVCNYASALSCLVVINGPHNTCMHMRAVLWRLWWLVRCHARVLCSSSRSPGLWGGKAADTGQNLQLLRGTPSPSSRICRRFSSCTLVCTLVSLQPRVHVHVGVVCLSVHGCAVCVRSCVCLMQCARAFLLSHRPCARQRRDAGHRDGCC